MKILSAEFLLGAVSLNQLPDDQRKEIAFLGRSNVGKSSLISFLCKRKQLARSGGTPGKTREINYYLINKRFYFVDLPGYGFARLPEQLRASLASLIEGYLKERRTVACAIQVIDARHEPTPLDLMMIGWLDYYEIPFVVVLTKADKLPRSKVALRRSETEQFIRRYAACRGIVFSSVTNGEGRKEILNILSDYVS